MPWLSYGNNNHKDMCFATIIVYLSYVANQKGNFNGKGIVAWRDEIEGETDCCGRTAMASQPDFKAQRGMLQEAIIAAGHEVIFYPKFHCELNYIENFWDQQNGMHETIVITHGRAWKERYHKLLHHCRLVKLEDILRKLLGIWMCIVKAWHERLLNMPWRSIDHCSSFNFTWC